MNIIKNKKYNIYQLYSNTILDESFTLDKLKSIDIYAFERYSNKSILDLNKLYNSISITLEINTSDINTISYINNNITNLPSNSINLSTLVDQNTGERLSNILKDVEYPIIIRLRATVTQMEKSNGSELIILVRKTLQNNLLF